MAIFGSLFGREAPARVETDLVIPVGFMDDNPLMKRIALYNLHVYDDVLDPEKLREALDRLVRRDGWGKMGARLRSTVRPFHTLPGLLWTDKLRTSTLA